MRINEIAKEVGKSNKEVLDFVNKNGGSVTSHLNKIEEVMIEKVRKAFSSKQVIKQDMKSSSNIAINLDNKVEQKEDKKNVSSVYRPQNSKQNKFDKNANDKSVNTKFSSGQGVVNQDNKQDISRNFNNKDKNFKNDNKHNKPINANNVNNSGSSFDKNNTGKNFVNNQNKNKAFENKKNDRPFNKDDKNRNGVNRNNTGARNNNFNSKDNKPFNKDRSQNFKDMGFSKDKDNDEVSSRNHRQAPKKDNKMSGLDASLVKKSTSNRANKNDFKDKKNDKKNRTEDGKRGVKVTKHPFIMPVKKQEPVIVEDIKEIIIPERLTVKDFSSKLKLQPSVIVKKLFLKGQMVNVNSFLSFEEMEEIALEYDIISTLEEKVDVIAELLKEDVENEEFMVKRPPVVSVMGHVDHGKTSLLDAIRNENVVKSEAGGITQHIGAYMVKINGEPITFLDTPGHEAFTSMRLRGAMSTDIAILVVAADDGVMPQTVEAISHAKAAGIDIIVAVNKMDKPAANIDRVKQELTEHELIAEDWGGTTIFCPVSAKTGEGIENLLEMILLTAELKELKANKNRKARGLVIEAKLDKGKGPVATVLVQKGTLKVGDFVAAGSSYGKVRAMTNERGQRLKEATPSTPVEILGLNDVPNAGEVLVATESDKEAKDFAATFISENKNKLIEDTKAKLSLDDLFSQIKAGNIKELPIIIKADVQGSVEAVKQSLVKLSNEEVAVKIIHGGVGAINESDVSLAAASNAIIIGFNVRPDATAKSIADREKVDLRLYKVIYQAIEDVMAALNGMLEPIYEERVIGHAEIRQIFKASGIGNIGGSYILDGKFVRGSKVRITRAGEQIFEGNLASLKRFKDDVKEVSAGYECGLVFEKFNDIMELDQVEAYEMVEVPRK